MTGALCVPPRTNLFKGHLRSLSFLSLNHPNAVVQVYFSFQFFTKRSVVISHLLLRLYNNIIHDTNSRCTSHTHTNTHTHTLTHTNTHIHTHIHTHITTHTYTQTFKHKKLHVHTSIHTNLDVNKHIHLSTHT